MCLWKKTNVKDAAINGINERQKNQFCALRVNQNIGMKIVKKKAIVAGRNRRDTADYFSHDSDASSDEKIVYLESLFGHTGYAVYFKFLERMVRSKNFEIEWNDVKKTIYAKEFSISVTEIDRIITECCRKEIEAFNIVDGKMFSPGLKKRMQPLLEKREYNRIKYEKKKKDNYLKCKNNSISVTEINRNDAENNRNDTVKERKVKERKVKERIYTDKLKTFVGSYIKYISKTFGSRSPKGANLEKNSLITVDKLIRIDGFKEDYVFDVLRWSQQDDFWKEQVLSLSAIRKKSKNGLTKFQNLTSAYESKIKATTGDPILDSNLKAAAEFLAED